MKVKVKKIHPDGKLPRYSTEGAACFDISGVELDDTPSMTHRIVFNDDTALVKTGLIFEVPKDHVMLIFSRSGHGFKDDISLSNCVGVIDSDYRGELVIKVRKDANAQNNSRSFVLHKNDRIAQGMILPVTQVQFERVDELGETTRGANGFGSTGV